MRILIVDDNPDNIDMMMILLKSENHDVISANNGKEALDRIRSGKFDLIISDILMPVMDGFLFCRECKKDPELGKICFIFYTATYIDVKDEEFALSLGAQKFIRKPQEPEVLINLIKEVIEKWSSENNAPIKSAEQDEKEILKLYSERLVAKLEKKNLDLENEIASHKKTLNNLKESEELFRNLFQNNLSVMLLINPDTGQIVDANQSAEKYYGWSHQQLTSMRIQDINTLHEDTIKEIEQVVSQKKIRFEFQHRLANGSVRDVEVFSCKIDIRGKEFLHSIIHDITKSKQAEETIIKDRTLLRTLVDNLPTGIFVKDKEYRKIIVNPVHIKEVADHLKYLGMNTEIDILGKTDFEVFPEELAKKFFTDDQKVVRDGSVILNNEGIGYYEDGKQQWMLVSKIPLRDKNDEIIGMIGVTTDITERKRTEEEIKILNSELEQRIQERTAELSDLYNNAPCGYHLLDDDGLFVNINDTELKWLGYNRDEIVGKKKFSDLLNEESAREFSMNFPVFKKQGWMNDLEFDMVRKDGSILPVLLSATTITDAEGNYLMSRSTIIDNTERKQAEETMFESQQKLEQLNRELEAFAYSVSHDLRSPLRAINGFTRILLEEYNAKIDEEGQRLCRVINDNALKMGQLIDDLLAFSRLNRSTLNYLNVDMKAMASRVFDEIAEPAKKSMIVFDLKELPAAFCDPSLLKQVWINLLSNAVKYTRKCENPTITVGYEPSEAEVKYFIKDNGVGFEQKFADKLFGVFQRLHSSAEFEGTGVGLAIVQRIINRHGGRVWAEGEVNKGAVFYFTLPKNDMNHKT